MHASFDREEFSAPMAEINTTPLVDVMLVLLVIFLVTAPMLTNTIKMELPNEAAAENKDLKPISLSLDAAGQYYWNSAPITEEALAQRMKEAAAVDPKQPIHLHADTNITYGKVSHVLALAQRSGLINVGFVTEPR